MLSNKLLSTVGGEETLYSSDVFSAYTYVGNGATQTINNGIDLAGKGGLVWTKCRSTTQPHTLVDTSRGVRKNLSSDSTFAEFNDGTVNTFTTEGYSLDNSGNANASGSAYVSWTFRKAPKFFDIVTYTGNGVAGRQIPHALGIAPGMVIVKCTSHSVGWLVWHKSATGELYLDMTTAQQAEFYGVKSSTPTALTVDSTYGANWNNYTYVAYLFAHDSSADGIVQCGSFTTDAAYQGSATLGWEPQFVLVKNTSISDDWWSIDTARGWSNGTGNDEILRPNTSGAAPLLDVGEPNATGFRVYNLQPSNNYIYLAIRRPNKPPTTGTQVYNAIARTGTGAAATVTGVGFAPDLVNISIRNLNTASHTRNWFDRLRGKSSFLGTSNTSGEGVDSAMSGFDTQDGIALAADSNGYINNASFTYINHFFKRAPGVFDICCYTGTGVAKTEAHSLGVVPELMIIKNRTTADQWLVYHNAFTSISFGAYLNTTGTPFNNGAGFFNNTLPTTSVFSIGTAGACNLVSNGYVAYLFATKVGISKVFSYTGNGSSQTIDCGFTTGCRFFLVKASSTTGSWWVYDSVRGISAAADPALQLNSTAAEITSADAVDPHVSGVIVNQEATCSINASGVTYIGLAFA